MRRSRAVVSRLQTQDLSTTIARTQAESSVINTNALTLGGGGGGGGASLVSVSSLESTIELAPLIENPVPVLSSTPTVVRTMTLPSDVKGKNCILYGFFQLYAQSTFSPNQTFEYGFQIDDGDIKFGDSEFSRYTQSVQSLYAIGSGASIIGTGGLNSLQPISFPLSIPSGAKDLKLAIRNSSASMVVTPTEVLGASTSFSYTGSVQTFTVPAGINNLYIYLWGAGGGDTINGGAGAFVSGTYAVSPGQVLHIVVGQAGARNGTNGPISRGGGGGGYNSGGGFSGVFTSSTLSHATLIACAAGGGGAGPFGNNIAGSGGVLTGFPGQTGDPPSTGGTQTEAGIANGTALVGGITQGGDGSGGGGGYYGGGGARAAYGGGGGGSSYTGGFVTVLGTEGGGARFAGITRKPGGTTNQFYISPRGEGQQNGQVTIVQAVTRSPTRVRTNIKFVAL